MANSHPGITRHPSRGSSSGPVPRRTFPAVRSEFIRMCEPNLARLSKVDALCEELLASFDSDAPPDFEKDPDDDKDEGDE